MYAYFKKLDYFSTECIYSPNAYRGHARTFLKDLEAVRPSAIIGKHKKRRGGNNSPIEFVCRYYSFW